MKYLDDFPELSELSELLAYSSAELKVRTRFGASCLAFPFRKAGRRCLADGSPSPPRLSLPPSVPSASAVGS